MLCTDSDGYSVGFRIKSDAVEFDNLGVIGETDITNWLEIYNNTNDTTIIVNGNILPATSDTTISSNKLLRYSNGIWKYVSLSEIIDEHVDKALKNLQTVPTGSIHWVPITYEQYEKNSDSLKTDYLLCDGKTYNSEEYPELAKILSDGASTFNVPNLQNKFISAVLAKGSTKLNEKLSPDDIYSCDSGVETCDCNDPNERPDTKQHRHFVAYGSWKDKPSYDNTTYNPQYCAKPSGVVCEFSTSQSLENGNTLPSLKDGDTIGILPLNNHATEYQGIRMVGFGENTNSNGVDSVPANILLSKPNHNKPQINCEFVGQSSKVVKSGDIPSQNKQENHGKYYPMLPFIKT